ncbi:hypothetical protein RclHR1_33160001 [Rhizophagus clarus]|uniref:SAM domain-containing protein n=1 Tax=Rhizophagus clarus TaxID=94130 RepID=A0A2Z6RQD3_9GLOM|nr:hypothetical protein RclHR1_33160001 [Rhizophagus clarus]
MSETNTPASTSTTATATGNDSVTLADEIKKYKSAELIEFLRKEEDLGLDDDDLEIIRNENVTGRAFLDMTEQKFRDCGLKIGPAVTLAKFAKECKEKKLRAFSSYRSLEEVLEKYGIRSNSITSIPQFEPVVDNNEAMRCEYISTILHTAVSLLGGLIISPQLTIIGTESSGRVDYAIKKKLDELLEEIICITEGKQNQPGKGVAQNLMQCRSSCEMNLDMLKKKRKADEAFETDYEYVYGIVSTATDWYFILYSTEAIYCTSRTEYRISLTEEALKDPTDLPQFY